MSKFCLPYSTAQLLTGLLHEFRDEIVLSVLGSGGGRILQLWSKTNIELLALYDPEIVLRLHNARNLKDTRRLLSLFMVFLGDQKPSAELAKLFLATR